MACVISSIVMGIAAAIVNYFILLPLFETFMPLDHLIASFCEFLPFIETKLDSKEPETQKMPTHMI